jgi:hypothetical protein
VCCDSAQCMWGDRIDVRLLGLFEALALHVDEEVARRRVALMLAGLRCQNLLEAMTPVLKVLPPLFPCHLQRLLSVHCAILLANRFCCSTAVVPHAEAVIMPMFPASG